VFYFLKRTVKRADASKTKESILQSRVLVYLIMRKKRIIQLSKEYFLH